MDDDLAQFLSYFKISAYQDTFNDQGAENLGDLRDLNEEEMNELASEVFPNNKPLHKKKFIKAWKQLRDGEYPPNPEQQTEIDTITQQLNQKNKVISHKLQEIQTANDELESDTTQRIKELQNKFQEMTETLNNHKKSVMNKFIHLKAKRKDKLDKDLETIKSLTTIANTFKSQTQSIVSDSSLSSSQKIAKMKNIMAQYQTEEAKTNVIEPNAPVDCKLYIKYDADLFKSQLNKILNVHMEGFEEKDESDASSGYNPTWSDTFKGDSMILSENNAKVTFGKAKYGEASARANEPIVRGQITKWIFEGYINHGCVSINCKHNWAFFGVSSDQQMAEKFNTSPNIDFTGGYGLGYLPRTIHYGARGLKAKVNHPGFPQKMVFILEMTADWTGTQCKLLFEYQSEKIVAIGKDGTYTMMLPKIHKKYNWYPCVGFVDNQSFCTIESA